MDNLINAFLAIGLLVVIILMVYLLDRVNSLEVETKRIGQVSVQAAAQASSAVSTDPWGGLQGKALWDALTGRPPAQLTFAVLEELRSRYEVVLHKHIQSLFDEGVRDAQRGVSSEPKNPRTVQTASGAVDAWMPMAQANTLYKCGMDSVLAPPEALPAVCQALDEAGQLLFSKVQIAQPEALSASLMPGQSGAFAGQLEGPSA